MKKLSLLVAILSFNIASSQAPKFQLAGKDTINIIDVGKKQGPWIIFGKDKNEPCYKPEQKAEEGKFKRTPTGEWVEYFCSGIPKSKVTFVNGRPDGYAITFITTTEKFLKKEFGKITAGLAIIKCFMRTVTYSTTLCLTRAGNRRNSKILSREQRACHRR